LSSLIMNANAATDTSACDTPLAVSLSSPQHIAVVKANRRRLCNEVLGLP
jgi:hypothetical protein